MQSRDDPGQLVRLLDCVCFSLHSFGNRAAAHLDVHPAPTRIWRVLRHYVDEAYDKPDLSVVRTIAVDEKSYRRGHRYINFIMDMNPALQRLLFGTVGWDANTLAAFVKDLRAHGGKAESIQDVCSDLSPAFIKGIRNHLQEPEITFDRFHLMKLMNEALGAVLREESVWAPGLKRTWYHWQMNPGDQAQFQKSMLRELMAMNLRTVQAYQMKLRSRASLNRGIPGPRRRS